MSDYNVFRALKEEVKASPGRSTLSGLQALGIIGGVIILGYYKVFPRSTPIDAPSATFVHMQNDISSGRIVFITAGSEAPVRRVEGYIQALDSGDNVIKRDSIDFVGFYPVMSGPTMDLEFRGVPAALQICVKVTNIQEGYTSENILLIKQNSIEPMNPVAQVVKYNELFGRQNVNAPECRY